jgi:Xaa-Pro aminopeptidase
MNEASGPVVVTPETTGDAPGRVAEVAGKVEAVRGWLERRDLSGVLFSTQANFAWITAGGQDHVSIGDSAGVAAVLVTRDSVSVLTSNIEAARLVDEELQDLPIEVVTYEWHRREPERPLVAERSDLARVVSDSGSAGLRNEGEALAHLRFTLSPGEIDRYRALGVDAARSVEEASLSARPGDTEMEIGGRVAELCVIRGILPLVNLVAVDRRIAAYRHPIPTRARFERTLLVALTGRRAGLHASLTRMVHLGAADDELAARHDAVTRVDAHMLSASIPGNTLRDVFMRAVKRYEAEGFPGEWELHHQGGLTGYAGREIFGTPHSHHRLGAHQACAWNPSITRVKSEDTIITTNQAPDVITRTKDWPQKQVEINGSLLERPAMWKGEAG